MILLILIDCLRDVTRLVLAERKSQGLQETDNQIFGDNASVSTTGK